MSGVDREKKEKTAKETKTMTTTSKQDAEFLSSLNLEDILQQAVDYLSKNVDPEDVFDQVQLELWAERNGYKRE